MTHPALRPVLLALTIALLPAGAALAGSGIYLNSAAIPGASTDPSREGQVDVNSIAWGVGVAIGSRAGTVPVIGQPNVQDLRWTQAVDSSIVPLFSNVTNRLSSAGFEVVHPGTASHAPYLSLTAEQTLISSLAIGGSGGEMVVQASLNPSAVTLTYDPGARGGSGSAVTTRYDTVTLATTGPSGRSPAQGPGTAPAVAGLYMRLGSGASAIAGDSRAIGYENWIAIGSYAMNSSLATSFSGQLTSQPSVSELSWSQSLDASAPAVLFNLLKGQAIGQVTIEQVAIDNQGRPVTVMQQALNDVLFSSFYLSTSSADNVDFAGSMNFTSFTQTLWSTLPDGSRGARTSFGYDVVHNVAMAGSLASNVAGFGNGNLDPSAPPAPVPEPQTWALLLAGVAVLAWVSRRRVV